MGLYFPHLKFLSATSCPFSPASEVSGRPQDVALPWQEQRRMLSLLLPQLADRAEHSPQRDGGCIFRERKESPLAQCCVVGVHHLRTAAGRCSTACCLPRACPWDCILAGNLGRSIFHSEFVIRSKLKKQASLVMLTNSAFVHAHGRPYVPREL